MEPELKKRLEITLEEYGKHVISVVQESMRKLGITSNGDQQSELALSMKEKTALNKLAVTIFMNDYWEFVDQGRKPGAVSEKGRKNIERWVKTRSSKLKGHPLFGKMLDKRPYSEAVKQVTFVIARKLKREGYKGKFFIEDAITQRLVDQLASDVAETMEDYLLEQLG